MIVKFNSRPKHIEELEEFATTQLQKLERYEQRIEKADIYYKADKDPAKPHHVEIKLAIPGPDTFAEDKSDTFARAFNGCIEKLEQQLKKRRAYHKDRK